MTKIPFLLSSYLGRLFIRWFFLILLILVILVGVFDFAELMRRGAHKPLMTISIVLEMVVLKMPTLIQRLFPFMTLFSTMGLLWQLNRHHELVVIKGSGFSVWQILIPLGLLSLLMNGVMLGVINPLGASMMNRYQQMESLYLKGISHRVSMGENGFWIRQVDPPLEEKGEKEGKRERFSLSKELTYTIIHASHMDYDTYRLHKPTFLRFNDQDGFLGRWDGESAILEKGFWRLTEAWETLDAQESHRKETILLPTLLTPQDIVDSAAPPTNLSVWQLPSFIAVFEKAGLSVIRHVVYWHGLLARPLFCLAMILLAACFCLRPLRQGRTGFFIAMGAGLGFITYVFSDITLAIGYSSGIPPFLAAWGPPLLATLGGLITLLHLEDG